MISWTGMLENLYGKHAAALYAQAADFNKTARFYYMKAEDAYYLANAQASYDDWRRARRQWDYFYRCVYRVFYMLHFTERVDGAVCYISLIFCCFSLL